ncbi:MAG TPA: hypothetical protein DEF45_09790 [Rhodopirellula sp.]|nr:hypothetical protein [Rhodopirellula sp.]
MLIQFIAYSNTSEKHGVASPNMQKTDLWSYDLIPSHTYLPQLETSSELRIFVWFHPDTNQGRIGS